MLTKNIHPGKLHILTIFVSFKLEYRIFCRRTDIRNNRRHGHYHNVSCHTRNLYRLPNQLHSCEFSLPLWFNAFSLTKHVLHFPYMPPKSAWHVFPHSVHSDALSAQSRHMCSIIEFTLPHLEHFLSFPIRKETSFLISFLSMFGIRIALFITLLLCLFF